MGKGAPLGSSDCPVEEGRVAGLIFQPLGPAVAVLIIQPLADFFGGSGARALMPWTCPECNKRPRADGSCRTAGCPKFRCDQRGVIGNSGDGSGCLEGQPTELACTSLVAVL